MLDAIQDACIAALEVAVKQTACRGRKSLTCTSAGVGILVRTFKAVRMPIYRSHPVGTPSPLCNSVRAYCYVINDMARRNGFSDEHLGTTSAARSGQNRSTEADYCSYSICMSHLDPRMAVNDVLKKYNHSGLRGAGVNSKERE